MIANPPASLKSSVSSLSTLQSAVSSFTDNASGSFVMVGYKSQNIVALNADSNGIKHIEGVQLERIVNKVSVKKITKAFESVALQSSTVKLEGAWIVMAKKQAGYTVGFDSGTDVAGTADADFWNYDSSHLESNALISWSIALASQPEIVASSGTAIDHDFYFYPNPAAVAASADVQDFVTKIVLKVNIGGTPYYYPIGIQQDDAATAARNRYYEISNVTLRRPGNPTTDDINDYIDASYIDVDMNVKDWSEGTVSGNFNYDLLIEDDPANGYEYVDLGLRSGGNKILFATMNVGAASPEEYGDYFAWGETSKRYTSVSSSVVTGGSFYWSNCPFHTGSTDNIGWNKYIPTDKVSYWSGAGDPDNLLTLEASDDVASVMWGGDWRMPDSSELELLYGSSVDYEYVYDYNGSGVEGLLITGKGAFAGASLFLPAAGYVDEEYGSGAPTEGFYWSRSLSSYIPYYAWILDFYDDCCSKGFQSRYSGLSVRPVRVVPE